MSATNVKKPVDFKLDVSGGDGYRKLRQEESEALKHELNQFSEQSTKIATQEIEFKKGLVKWLMVRFKDEALRGYVFRTFNTGSAYEKVQAGEAKDFDVMMFLNVRKWGWKVTDDPKKPEFCWITPDIKGDNERSFSHLLDAEGRLSSLKVRRLFTSKIDKFLRKHNPLVFKPEECKRELEAKLAKRRESKYKHNYMADTENETEVGTAAEKTAVKEPAVEEESFKVEIKRKHQGPSTTLVVECQGITPFTLDLVNSLHGSHVRRSDERCDYVAKPYDKQRIFSTQYEHMWRKSYSREESAKLRDIDRGNKTHKKLLRIFKMLRMNQPQLKLLKTYIFKNLLLYMSDVPGKDWSDEHIADRFVEMVIALRNCLSERKLPVYFNGRINLLQEPEYKQEQLFHVMAYLRRIANKGIEGYQFMLTEAQKEKPTIIKRKQDDPETALPLKTQKKSADATAELTENPISTQQPKSAKAAKLQKLRKRRSVKSAKPDKIKTSAQSTAASKAMRVAKPKWESAKQPGEGTKPEKRIKRHANGTVQVLTPRRPKPEKNKAKETVAEAKITATTNNSAGSRMKEHKPAARTAIHPAGNINLDDLMEALFQRNELLAHDDHIDLDADDHTDDYDYTDYIDLQDSDYEPYDYNFDVDW